MSAGPLRPSQRSSVPAFEAMAITDKVATLRAQGRDIISLCVGEPRGGAPDAVNDRAQVTHGQRSQLGYTSPLGIRPLREKVAEHYRRWYGLDVDPAQVAITTGSSGAFVLIFLAAFDPGDRVALARPGYPAYRNVLRALGVDAVEIGCGPDERFQPTPAALDALVAESGPIDGLIVASPANPTGTMVGRDELAALVEWCAANGVRLISDEIYHGLSYASGAGDGGDEETGDGGVGAPAGAEVVGAPEGGPAAGSTGSPSDGTDGTSRLSAGGADRGTSAWEFDRDTVVVSSFSKYWGMTGWRLGWALCPADLLDAVDALAGNVALCPPAPAQLAALEAFGDESYRQADERVAALAGTRGAALARAPELGWGHLAPADGAFYLWADLGEQLRGFADSTEYCAALLEEAGVALTPGRDFDDVDGGSYVRLSFGGGTEAVTEAMDRIVAWQQAREEKRG